MSTRRLWLAVGVAILGAATVFGVLTLGGGAGPAKTVQPVSADPSVHPSSAHPPEPLVLSLGPDVGLPASLRTPSASSGSARAHPTVSSGIALSPEPKRGVVWRLEAAPVPEATVVALARALGIRSKPVHVGRGWTVSSGRARLRVFETPGDRWAYDRTPYDVTCPVSPTSGDDPYADSTCGIGPGVVDKRTESEARARKTLAPLLRTLQLPRPAVSAWGWAAETQVVPLVAGQRVYGLRTWASVNRQGVTSAYGWLAPVISGGLEPVGSYPLVSPKSAFRDLVAASACYAHTVSTSGPRPSATGTPVPRPCRIDWRVTAVSNALVLGYDGHNPDLVPVWTFTEALVSPLNPRETTAMQLAVDPSLARLAPVPVPANLLPPGPSAVP